MDLTDWFVPSLPVVELLIRGTITYLLLFLLLRLVGRRESAGVGITDVLVVILLAEAASAGMVGEGETIGDGFILVIVILFWSVVIDALSYRFPWIERLVKSKPRPLIKEGRLIRTTMRREFMTYEEIMTQLRLRGFTDPSEVYRAYLEPNGEISVVSMEEAEHEANGGTTSS